ncbi:hypothetical protein QM996_02535 [Sinorhizobium chiapasense]
MAKITKTKKVDEDALVSTIAKAVREAVGVSVTHIANKQEEALKLYMRELFPTDKKGDGKSKFVSADVQERTDWATAQLIRVFDNQQQVVSFCPNESNDQPVADQMTDVCNFVVRSKNSHVAMLSPWVKNGFLTGLGVTMVEFRKEREELKPELLKGVADQQLVDLVAQEEAGKIVIEERGEPYDAPQVPPIPGLPDELAAMAQQMQPKVRDIKIRRVRDNIQLNILNLPPEDFIVSKDAQFDQQTGGIRARLQGHKRVIARSELIEMGFDAKKVAAIPSADEETEGMALQRSKETDFDDGVGEVEDDVIVYEIYTRLAIEDSKRRHYRLVLAGDLESKPVLLHREEVSKFYPYAAFAPFPIPNTLFGQGMVDRVGPTQRIVTQYIREQHNNLNKHVNPIVVVNPDTARPDDLLNLHAGKVIRSEDPTGGLNFVQQPLTTMALQPAIDSLRTELDYTTGVGGALASVNASDLQNTTATANAQRASSQQMLVEQICREFADTGYRYLFRIIVDLFVNNPEEAEIFIRRLTGNYAPIRIDEWDADMDVTANVAFGVTDKIGNAANLQSVLGLQTQFQEMGLANPQTIYTTATKIAENAGFKNASAFFVDPSTLPPPPADQPPPPNPLVEAEEVKAAAAAAENEKDRQLKIALAEIEDRRARERDEQDFRLKARELELKYQAQVDVARIEAEVAAQQQAARDQEAAFAQADKERAQAEAQAQQAAQEQAAQAQTAQQQPAMPPQAPMMPQQQ